MFSLIDHTSYTCNTGSKHKSCMRDAGRATQVSQTKPWLVLFLSVGLSPTPLPCAWVRDCTAMSWVRLRSTISTYSRRQTLQNNQISDLAEHLQTKPKDGASAVGEKSPVIFYNPSTDVKSIQQKSLSSYLNIINVWNLVLLVLLAKYFRYFEWSVIFFKVLTNKKTIILESNYDVYEDRNWL